MIASFGISDAGPVRANNEDCLLNDDELSRRGAVTHRLAPD